VIQSALEDIIPPDHIFGTQFRYNQSSGEIDSIIRSLPVTESRGD